MQNLTPLMEQHERLKKQYPDCIIFFRLGDFYEMFGEDAKYASSVLQIVLTRRGSQPMCGVPFHSADNYLTKLVRSGKKVAVVEQMEEAGKDKKLVKRNVVRIMTPGTLTGEELSPNTNNFILSVYPGGPSGQVFNCVMADITTSELIARVVPETDFPGFLKSSEKIREAIFPEGSEPVQYLSDDVFKVPMEKSCFDEFAGREKFKELFKVSSVQGFEMEDSGLLRAAAALFGYLERAKIDVLSSIRKISRIHGGENLFLDSSSIRNLELVENSGGGDAKNTLFAVLDRTKTPQGGRLLKRRLLNPAAKIEKIRQRQKEVTEFLENCSLMDEAGLILTRIKDIERASSRISISGWHPRDFLILLESLNSAEILKQKLSGPVFPKINTLPKLRKILENSLEKDTDGYIKIKQQFSPKLTEIERKLAVLEKWIKNLEDGERKRLSIPKLKVGFNSVFGYYIEVSKVNMRKVPVEYIRKQTLVNCERFITHRLKEKETEILILKEELLNIQKDAWMFLAGEVKKFLAEIKNLSHAIASADVSLSLAETAIRENYVMPDISGGDELTIENGRHPVVEKMQTQVFTPNSVFLNRKDNQIMLITGPNMAGKSTFIRQTALIVILAQMGSAVPASSAKIGIADRIFTRIGSGDNLAQGSSTFMVEMVDAANILNNSTEKSLIIIDELGRGTSTYDGISIAQACLEYLAKDKRHSRCLFATHFFELVELQEEFKNIKNFNATVKEWQGKLHFLHKIEPGPADRSYGIHVARLAGIPEDAVKRAGEILKKLEAEQFGEKDRSEGKQLTFLSNPWKKYGETIEKIKALNLNETMPVDALKILDGIKKELEEEKN
ncbi:MAG: DNA mismatch repair protein MutS [bacterium]